MAKKLRYRLHWASGQGPKPSLKWVIYDWVLICPVAHLESRVTGRKVCALLNAVGPCARCDQAIDSDIHYVGTVDSHEFVRSR